MTFNETMKRKLRPGCTWYNIAPNGGAADFKMVKAPPEFDHRTMSHPGPIRAAFEAEVDAWFEEIHQGENHVKNTN